VSNWTDDEWQAMTNRENDATTLYPTVIGMKAVIGGHDIAAKSGRIRHAHPLGRCRVTQAVTHLASVVAKSVSANRIDWALTSLHLLVAILSSWS
jgi:hypothetical protein